MPPIPRPTKGSNAYWREGDVEPLALELLRSSSLVQGQFASPLYSKLVPEIREIIFRYALQQYEDHAFPYDIAKRWVRPGRSSALRVAIELLLTCRAVYAETFCMPVACNAVHIFDGDPRDWPNAGLPLHKSIYNLHETLKMRPWQFAAITRVDLTLQQHKLEGGALERCSRNLRVQLRHSRCRFNRFNVSGYRYPLATDSQEKGDDVRRTTVRMSTLGSPLSMDHICVGLPVTHLTIRLNRFDWWTWTDDPTSTDLGKILRLEPMMNYTCPPENSAMQRGREARRQGREPDFGLDAFEASGRWGTQITEFWPDLQVLELILETFEPKEAQLDGVIACAKLWQFALQDGNALQYSGGEEVTRWQGAARYGYEHETPWMADQQQHATNAARNAARAIWRRITGNGQQEQGQRFVVKSLTYRRGASFRCRSDDSR